jgi:hypothetical protein
LSLEIKALLLLISTEDNGISLSMYESNCY